MGRWDRKGLRLTLSLLFARQLIDAESLEVIKSYITTTPLNSAAILTDRSLVLLGGGQDAMNVTTTGARQGQFEVRFWHQVFEEELARVKGGFGPCNTYVASSAALSYSLRSSAEADLSLCHVQDRRAPRRNWLHDWRRRVSHLQGVQE